MAVRILVPVDNSKASRECQMIAGRIAKTFGAQLTLFHAVDIHGVQHKNISGMHLDMIREKAREMGQRFIEGHAKELTAMGLSPRVVLMEGEAAPAVCEEAQRGYEMIMLGTQVHSDIRQMLIGSVSTALINHCKIPITVIKTGGPTMEELSLTRPMRLMMAVDKSHASERCVEYIAHLSAAGALEITLVHIKEQGMGAQKEPEELLKGYAARLQMAGYKVKSEVREGEPGKELSALFEEGEFDLVAAGKAKPTEVRERPGFSVGHYLFHHCKGHQIIVP